MPDFCFLADVFLKQEINREFFYRASVGHHFWGLSSEADHTKTKEDLLEIDAESLTVSNDLGLACDLKNGKMNLKLFVKMWYCVTLVDG